MKPPRVVILIDADEERQSITRFMLQTNRYRVVSPSTPEEVVKFGGFTADCVLGFWPLNAGITDAIAKLYAVPFVLAVPDADKSAINVYCSRLLFGADTTPTDIINAAKVACTHKRGPKKASVINASHEAEVLLGVA